MGVKIFVAIVVGFLGGVFVRSFVSIGYSYVLFCLLLATALLLLTLVEVSKRVPIIVCAVALISFGLGVARMHTSVLSGDVQLTAHLNQRVYLRGVVSAEPDVRDASTRLTVDVAAFASSTQSINAKVLVVVAAHTKVDYGDEIIVSGVLTVPESFDTGNGRFFAYPEYLASSGIGYEVSPAEIHLTGHFGGNTILRSILSIKQTFLAGLQSVLPEPEAGLAAGITVGDKRSIGPQLSHEFQVVSLIHMVVLSGYNITIVINAVAYFLGHVSWLLQGFGSVLVVAFFVGVSGGSASAVRAGVMALLVVYARGTHRTFDALRAIAFTAVVMVLWNPFELAFDPSFQLSVLATVGMVTCTPILTARLQWLTARWGVREIVSSTLGTQIVVLPFLLYQSGNISLYALPANVLALIPVPLSMLASCVASVAGLLLGHAGVAIAFVAYALLSYIIGVAHVFSHFPYAMLSVPVFPLWVLGISYVALFALVYKYYPRSA